MNNKKLYRVDLEYTICVFAIDESHAEFLAVEAIQNEEPEFTNAIEITDRDWIPNTWNSSIPYGEGEKRTCTMIVKEMQAEKKKLKEQAPVSNPDQLCLNLPNCS